MNLRIFQMMKKKYYRMNLLKNMKEKFLNL